MITIVIFVLLLFLPSTASAQSSWTMAGGNVGRTGWIQNTSRPTNSLLWSVPIEAYIDQKVQLVTFDNKIFVSTSRGLIVLHADSGQLSWRYDTNIPLGHSPTIDTSTNPATLYVGGLDKKLYAFNAQNGTLLWTYDGALAGYGTNPLIIDGKVIIGNRDGSLYAIGAHGTAQASHLIWKFTTNGPINFSPAYHSNRIFIASNDNHAYAINSNTGQQIWKSAALPGDGFHSYYPVIYKDKVIFGATYIKGNHAVNEFRAKQVCPTNQPCYYEPIIPGDPEGSVDGTLIGTVEAATATSEGWNTLFPWRVLKHFAHNPNSTDPYFFKPENRAYLVLNQSDGNEFTFTMRGETYNTYIPFSFWQLYGNNYPLIIDPNDQIAYGYSPIACCSDAKGKVYGWNIQDPNRLIIVGATANISTNTISSTGGWAAMAEPQAISGGGTHIYRNLCCDRVGDVFGITYPGSTLNYWTYMSALHSQIPNYDDLWTISPRAISRHIGWYSGTVDTESGIYHSHGNQAPLIPYGDRLYAHRSNRILAYGSGTPRGNLPLIPINTPQSPPPNIPSQSLLIEKLQTEIQKILSTPGHLRPGWSVINLGNYGGNRQGFEDYFGNPGDTLYTLSYAYPHLNDSLKSQVSTYLSQALIPDYFDTNPTSSNPTMYAAMGYTEGAAREWLTLPAETFNTFSPMQKRTTPGTWLWTYPQHNMYAMYLYAKNVPGVNVQRLYQLAKNKVQVPVPNPANSTLEAWFTNEAFEHNAWITGYIGFLKLQELAGATQSDAALRTSVTNEKNRLVSLRASLFNQETPWINRTTNYANNYKKSLDVARNFMFLVPELAEEYRSNPTLYTKARNALALYDYIAPYWFISKYESSPYEDTWQAPYNSEALLNAMAWINRSSRSELYQYLDTPMFAKGDLFYINNLITIINSDDINAPPASPTPTPSSDLDNDGDTDFFDLSRIISWFNQSNCTYNLLGSCLVDIFDVNSLIRRLLP